MIHSRLEPVKEPARLVRRRFAEVVAHLRTANRDAVLEGADSVVRAWKRRACGLSDIDYFTTILSAWRATTSKPSPPPPR